jgi:hypothetical protein
MHLSITNKMNIMKKLFSLGIIVILFLSHLNSQTVDSIRVEQAGDFVKVRYKILNSRQDQIFKVKVLCSINGGMNNEIRSITGDVGDKVVGGKTEYWILWDVLKDVDELKTAEFIVRADLIKEEEKNIETKASLYIMPVVELVDGLLYGGRIAFMGDWGGSVRFTAGARGTEESNYEKTYSTNGFSLDLTRRIINKENFQIHIMAGIARSKFETVNRTSMQFSTDSRWGPEVGAFWSIRKIALSLGMTFFTTIVDDMEITSSPFFINAGIGIKF